MWLCKTQIWKKAKCCYIDTDSFILWIKIDDICKDIAEDVSTRLDTSNCELECNSIERSLPKGRNKKVIGLIKNELRGKLIAEYVALKVKTYSHLIDEGSEDRKAKGTKKSAI